MVRHRHGDRFTIPAGISILGTQERNGVPLQLSCREGLCRSCEAPLLSDRAYHQDHMLSDAEREARRTRPS